MLDLKLKRPSLESKCRMCNKIKEDQCRSRCYDCQTEFSNNMDEMIQRSVVKAWNKTLNTPLWQ